MDEKKVISFIKTNISYIVVAIISVFYIFWGSVQLHLKNLNWWELICYVATTLTFGICVANLIGEGGFIDAKKDERYVKTRRLLIAICNALINYKDEANEYVNEEIDKEIDEERKTILHRAGVPYIEVFDENRKTLFSDTFLRKTNKYTKKQKKSIRQAIRLKKYDFTLFAYSSTKVIGRKKETSETEYRRNSLGKDFIVRVLLAVISGSIMFTFSGFDVASVIYAAFQMVMWIGSGVMKRQQNYNFVVITMRETDLDRIGYLKAFAGKKGITLDITKEKEDN